MLPRLIIVLMMVMVVIVGAAVGAAFRLKGGLNSDQSGSKTLKHFLHHVVGANSKSVFANLGREMAIPKMPGESHQLMAVLVPDFHECLRCGNDCEPGSVVELQSVAIGHGHG